MPTVIERLTHRHPRLSFHIVEAGLPTLQRDLRDRSIELLIAPALTPIVEEDMETEVLFKDRHLVVAGSRNKWVGRRKIKIAELLDEPWIFPSPGSLPASLVSAAFLDSGVKVPRATVSSLSLHAHFFLLAAGRYLALLPESTVRHIAEHLPITVLPVDLKTKPRPVVIVTTKGRTLSPAAQRFIECAREIAKPLSKRHTN